mgnify:CR=1 FL=1
MNPETLLGLISGGRYGTSADLPTVPEMAHSYIDQIKDTYDQRQQVEMQIQGKGLGMLEWANIGVPFGASKQMAPLLKSIKEQLANGQITQEEYNSQLLTINTKFNLEKEALGLAKILIQTTYPDLNTQEGIEQLTTHL